MDYQEYEKIAHEYGFESDKAQKAYLELVITELKPITKEVVFDKWGWATLTFKDHIEMSGEELLETCDILVKADQLMWRISGNQIRMWTY